VLRIEVTSTPVLIRLPSVSAIASGSTFIPSLNENILALCLETSLLFFLLRMLLIVPIINPPYSSSEHKALEKRI